MSKYVETLLAKQQALSTKEKNKKVSLIEEINYESTHGHLTADGEELNHESFHDQLTTDLPILSGALFSSTEEQNEGPSMLDLMMAAQKEAYNAKKSDTKTKESPSFAGGFKKGFFKTKTSTQNLSKSTEIVNIPVIKQKVDKNSKSRVLEDVKNALKEEQMKSKEENEQKYGPLSQFLNRNGSFSIIIYFLRNKINRSFFLFRMGHSRLARCFASQ